MFRLNSVVYTLLENGADPNYRSYGGYPPIGESAWAIRTGIYINKGEDINAVNCIWLLLFYGASLEVFLKDCESLKWEKELIELLSVKVKDILKAKPSITYEE